MKNLFPLIIFTLILCSCGEKENYRSEFTTKLKEKSKEEKYKLILNEKLAPDDTLVSFDGKKILLSELSGKIIIIDFWATWCSPCYKGIPKFIDLATKYNSENINFILISIDPEYEFWRDEITQYGWTNNSYWIGDEDFNNSLYSLVYEQLELEQGKSIVTALPHYVVFDKHGRIHLNTAQTTPTSASFITLIDSLSTQ